MFGFDVDIKIMKLGNQSINEFAVPLHWVHRFLDPYEVLGLVVLVLRSQHFEFRSGSWGTTLVDL